MKMSFTTDQIFEPPPTNGLCGLDDQGEDVANDGKLVIDETAAALESLSRDFEDFSRRAAIGQEISLDEQLKGLLEDVDLIEETFHHVAMDHAYAISTNEQRDSVKSKVCPQMTWTSILRPSQPVEGAPPKGAPERSYMNREVENNKTSIPGKSAVQGNHIHPVVTSTAAFKSSLPSRVNAHNTLVNYQVVNQPQVVTLLLHGAVPHVKQQTSPSEGPAKTAIQHAHPKHRPTLLIRTKGNNKAPEIKRIVCYKPFPKMLLGNKNTGQDRRTLETDMANRLTKNLQSAANVTYYTQATIPNDDQPAPKIQVVQPFSGSHDLVTLTSNSAPSSACSTAVSDGSSWDQFPNAMDFTNTVDDLCHSMSDESEGEGNHSRAASVTCPSVYNVVPQSGPSSGNSLQSPDYSVVVAQNPADPLNADPFSDDAIAPSSACNKGSKLCVDSMEVNGEAKISECDLVLGNIRHDLLTVGLTGEVSHETVLKLSDSDSKKSRVECGVSVINLIDSDVEETKLKTPSEQRKNVRVNLCLMDQCSFVKIHPDVVFKDNICLSRHRNGKICSSPDHDFDPDDLEYRESDDEQSQNSVDSDNLDFDLNDLTEYSTNNDDFAVCVCGKNCGGVCLLQDLLDDGLPPTEHRCSMCFQKFETANVLISHILQHDHLKPFTCQLCNKGFARHDQLTRHFRNIHSGDKPRPYHCSGCGKKFGEAHHLRVHMQLVHTKDRPLKCGYCGKGFVLAEHLERHTRIHTGERPYKCGSCQKKFVSLSNLYRHQKVTHEGIKDFTCFVCGVKFGAASHLNIHMRTHTGEKPFQCAVCGKSFAKKAGLTRHTKVHCGGRPFQCTVCNKGYKDEQYMKTHMLKKHKIKIEY